MSLGDGGDLSVTDLVPTAWERRRASSRCSTRSTSTSTSPARPTTWRPARRPSSASPRSAATIGETDGLVGVLLPARRRSTSSSACSTCSRCCRSTAGTRRSPPTSGSASATAGATSPTSRKMMPFAMGVIVVLLMLFMSGLYLDITKPLAMRTVQRLRAPADTSDPRRLGRRRWRRADHGAVDDDHQDGRRRGHAAADLRAGRGRVRHRPLHVQRGGGGRGAGPDRAPLADPDHRRHPPPVPDGAGGDGGGRARAAPQPRQHPQARAHQGGRRRGTRPQGADPHRRQRRVARSGAVREVRRRHARGDGRVGPAGDGLLRRGRLRPRSRSPSRRRACR